MGENQKNTFPVEVLDKNYTIDTRVRQITSIAEKNVEKSVPFQNGGHFIDFPSA